MNRTTLLSIDFESDFTSFGDYGPGIWQSRITMSQGDRDASFWGAMGGTWSDELKLFPQVIGTVKDRLRYYPEVEQLIHLFIVDYGFYFDIAAQTVYIKFEDCSPWYIQEQLDYGESLRFIDAAGTDENTGLANQAYIDGVMADPRLIADSFTYYQKADKLEDNRMQFNNCTLRIINSDGELDRLREQTIGRTMRVYYASMPDYMYPTTLKEFVQVFHGTVSKVSFSGGDTVSVTGADQRSSLKEPILVDPFTLAEYPDMDPQLEGRSKNLVIGQVYRMPCVNVSDNGDNRTWSVNSVSNGVATLQNVYDGSPDNFTPVDPSDYSYDAGTGNLVMNRDPEDDLRADIIGSGVRSQIDGADSFKAVDVVLNAMWQFSGYPFISSFWDIDDVKDTWSRSPAIGIYIDDKGIKVKELIDKILSSANTRIFLKSVFSDDGIPRVKFSMKDMSIDQGIQAVRIDPVDCLSLPVNWWFEEEAHMTAIAVEYNPEIYSEVYKLYRDDSLENEAYTNTPIINEYKYTSFCTEYSDIITLAQQRYEMGIVVPYRVKGTLGTDLYFNLLDYVMYHHKRENGEILKDALWLVTGIDHIRRTFELSLIHEEAPDDIVEISGDLFGPDVMWNDNQYANLQGEFE